MNHHTDHHFDDALTNLKQQILIMGTKVESMWTDCINALTTGNKALAERVTEADHAVNALELAIDEHCIELLARYQPAASDLRFITRGLKIVTDLERVGDLAVNTAQRVIQISEHGQPPIDITNMANIVQKMLRDALDSFVNKDAAKAEEVIMTDDTVDELTEKYVTDLIERAKREPQNIFTIFPITSIIRYLERVADHSTNIAELAIFMIKGRDVRHGKPR